MIKKISLGFLSFVSFLFVVFFGLVIASDIFLAKTPPFPEGTCLLVNYDDIAPESSVNRSYEDNDVILFAVVKNDPYEGVTEGIAIRVGGAGGQESYSWKESVPFVVLDRARTEIIPCD